MTAVVVGPYEHAGSYVDREFFDTTGTPHHFCPYCEHAPCIAGATKLCSMRPRSIVVRSVREEILTLADASCDPPILRALYTAAMGLADAAREPGYVGDFALKDLAAVRDALKVGKS